eukprot:750320-Hanusia_phi.AAC.2
MKGSYFWLEWGSSKKLPIHVPHIRKEISDGRVGGTEPVAVEWSSGGRGWLKEGARGDLVHFGRRLRATSKNFTRSFSFELASILAARTTLYSPPRDLYFLNFLLLPQGGSNFLEIYRAPLNRSFDSY